MVMERTNHLMNEILAMPHSFKDDPSKLEKRHQ